MQFKFSFLNKTGKKGKNVRFSETLRQSQKEVEQCRQQTEFVKPTPKLEESYVDIAINVTNWYLYSPVLQLPPHLPCLHPPPLHTRPHRLRLQTLLLKLIPPLPLPTHRNWIWNHTVSTRTSHHVNAQTTRSVTRH